PMIQAKLTNLRQLMRGFDAHVHPLLTRTHHTPHRQPQCLVKNSQPIFESRNQPYQEHRRLQ
ncbi:hypothetical protein IscW_ISCW021051, partial [Ixodes scapularis]